jgi:DNA-binding IclR family transcriptional regulator
MAVAARKSSSKARREPRSLAPALSRGLQILELLAEAPRGLSLSEIAARLGIAKSSAFGLCTVLTERNFLQRSAEGMFGIGIRIVDLASARLGHSDLTLEFYAACESLGKMGEQTAVLSVLDGADVMYVACRNSPQPLGITFKTGMRLPACCTATGKAFLSTLSDDKVRALYRSSEIKTLTKAGVASVNDLLAQLAWIRETGVSIDNGETREHMYSVGAPILDRNGQAKAAVAICFYRAEVTPAQTRQAQTAVRTLAERLSRSVGLGETS